jgi:hypothetical protein
VWRWSRRAGGDPASQMAEKDHEQLADELQAEADKLARENERL